MFYCQILLNASKADNLRNLADFSFHINAC